MSESQHQKFKDQILGLIEANKAGIAYSKLTNLDDFRGTCLLSHARYPLVHYWEGLSEGAAEAILELTREGLVRHEPTDTLAYVAQGPSLNLPVFTAEHLSQVEDLGSPHWMPVLLLKNA